MFLFHNFRWLCSAPKCSSIKNTWDLKYSRPPKSFQKIYILEPSAMDESLIIHKYAPTVCVEGKGGEVDIINILYVRIFFWGGWCNETLLPEITHPEKPGKHVQLFEHQGELSWEWVRFEPSGQPSKFGVPNGLPGGHCYKHGWYLGKGHRNQRKFHFWTNQIMMKVRNGLGKHSRVRRREVIVCVGHLNKYNLWRSIWNSAYKSTFDTSKVELKTIQNKPTSGKSYIKHFRIVPTFRYSAKTKTTDLKVPPPKKRTITTEWTKKQNVESSECSCAIRYVLSSFQDQQGAIFFGSICSVLSISESRWESQSRSWKLWRTTNPVGRILRMLKKWSTFDLKISIIYYISGLWQLCQ